MAPFREQLRAGQTLTLVLIGAIAVTGIGVLHLISRRTSDVTYAYARTARDVTTLRVEGERLLAASRNYLISGTARDRLRVADAQHKIATALQHLEARDRVVSGELQALGHDLRPYLGRFDAIAVGRPGVTDSDELLGRFERESAAGHDLIERDVDALLNAEEQRLDAAFTRLGHLTRFAELTIAVASMLAVLLALVLGARVRAKLGEQVSKIEQAREQARIEAERRQELLSIVSHDLRTPLNAIALSAGLLESGHHSERAVRVIGGAAERMRRLVDQLLDLARVDMGEIAVDLSRFDGASVLDEIVAMVAMEADNRGVRLAIDACACRVIADRERVLQVLSNLASNALRVLHDRGTVVLRVAPREDRVRFEVVDDGPGIPADRVPWLFERSYQGPERRGNGLGLGLYICRKLVEAQRGRIGVTTELGKGSTFWFELPADGELLV